MKNYLDTECFVITVTVLWGTTDTALIICKRLRSLHNGPPLVRAATSVVALFCLNIVDRIIAVRDKGEQCMSAYRNIAHPTIDDVKAKLREADAEAEGLRRKLKAQLERDKRIKRWADTSTAVICLSIAALILSVIVMIIGPRVIKTIRKEANKAAVMLLEVADKNLEYSKSEVLREKTIAEMRIQNDKYVDNVYTALTTWAKTHTLEGIYSCKISRDAKTLLGHMWTECTILRDFNPAINLLCNDKECGGAKKKQQ